MSTQFATRPAKPGPRRVPKVAPVDAHAAAVIGRATEFVATAFRGSGAYVQLRATTLRGARAAAAVLYRGVPGERPVAIYAVAAPHHELVESYPVDPTDARKRFDARVAIIVGACRPGAVEMKVGELREWVGDLEHLFQFLRDADADERRGTMRDVRRFAMVGCIGASDFVRASGSTR